MPGSGVRARKRAAITGVRTDAPRLSRRSPDEIAASRDRVKLPVVGYLKPGYGIKRDCARWSGCLDAYLQSKARHHEAHCANDCAHFAPVVDRAVDHVRRWEYEP